MRFVLEFFFGTPPTLCGEGEGMDEEEAGVVNLIKKAGKQNNIT
jgi:hypothetical protein